MKQLAVGVMLTLAFGAASAQTAPAADPAPVTQDAVQPPAEGAQAEQPAKKKRPPQAGVATTRIVLIGAGVAVVALAAGGGGGGGSSSP